MSKAILVIDTPKSCRECPCFCPYYCVPIKKELGVAMSYVGIPINFCPLKPLPEKIDISEEELYEKQYICFEGGWNACIDEILGEEE